MKRRVSELEDESYDLRSDWKRMILCWMMCKLRLSGESRTQLERTVVLSPLDLTRALDERLGESL